MVAISLRMTLTCARPSVVNQYVVHSRGRRVRTYMKYMALILPYKPLAWVSATEFSRSAETKVNWHVYPADDS